MKQRRARHALKVLSRVSILWLFGIGGSFAQVPQVRVYRADGSLQCGMGRERTLDEDKSILVNLGAAVLSSEKKPVPLRIPSVCGAPTGMANTYVISEGDWNKVRRSFVGPAGFGRWIYDSETVEVYKYDGTLWCGAGKEVPLDVMETQLLDAGIPVISRRKATDGLLHIMVCSAITGSVNAFVIQSKDLQSALDMGFSYFTTSQTYKMILDQSDMSPTANGLTASSDGMPLPWPFPW